MTMQGSVTCACICHQYGSSPHPGQLCWCQRTPPMMYFGQGVYPYSYAAEQASIAAFKAMEDYWTARRAREDASAPGNSGDNS